MTPTRPGPEDVLEAAISELAHAFRTPLSVIVGYAELLQTRDDERTRREAPLRIQEAAETLMRLLDERVEQAERTLRRDGGGEPADGV